MARYWVGGGSTANWSATAPTNWSATSGGANNASVPSSTDDVFFDGVGTGASNSTLSANITVQSIDFTGYANTLTHNAAVTLTIGGATVVCTFSAGMTYTKGNVSTSAVAFTATSGTATLTSNGKTLGNVSKSGVGGTLSLADALSARTLTVTSGTFNANSQTVTAFSFNSSNSNVRSVTMGSGLWTITGNAATVWTTSTQTNLTFSAGSVSFTYAGATGTRTIVCVGTGTGIVRPLINITAGSDIVAIGAASIVATDLDFTGFTGNFTGSGVMSVTGNFTLGVGQTFSYTGSVQLLSTATGKTVNTAGLSLVCAFVFNGVGGGWALGSSLTTTKAITLSAGTFDANGFTVTALSFATSGINAKTLTMGSGLWTITGSGITVWDTSTGSGSVTLLSGTVQFTYAGGVGTRTITGRSSNRPTMLFVSGTDTVTFGNVTTGTNDLDFTGFGGILAGSASAVLNVAGDLTFSVGQATPTFAGYFLFSATSTGKTFTTANHSFVCNFQIQGVGGGWTQVGDFLTTGLFNLYAGSYDVNGNTFSTGSFDAGVAGTRSFTMLSGTLYVTGVGGGFNFSQEVSLTLNLGTTTLEIDTTTDPTGTHSFTGGNASHVVFNDLHLVGPGGATFLFSQKSDFKELKCEVPSALLGFGGTYTTKVETFSVEGTSGNPVTLYTISGSPVNYHTLIYTGASKVSKDYLNIQGLRASPTYAWYAGLHSVDVDYLTNPSTGWIFNTPQSKYALMPLF